MLDISKDQYKMPKLVSDLIKDHEKGNLDSGSFAAGLKLFGIYADRRVGRNEYTLRTRIPGGIISNHQLKEINRINNDYSNNPFHLTTRQNIQFQKVKLKVIPLILEELLAIGITTKASAGKVPRNIVAPALSGVEDEVFDVSPYVMAITENLLKDNTNLSLPAKFQISISNNDEDHSNSKMADLGFIAKEKNGVQGFEVYGGGGQGSYAKLGLLLLDFIKSENISYAIDAMKKLLIQENEERKIKKRTRFIARDLGDKVFTKLYKEFYEEGLNQKLLPELDIKKYEFSYILEPGDFTIPDCINVYESSVRGRYSVCIKAENGNYRYKDLSKILDFISKLEYAPSIRISHEQGFFIRELKGSDVDMLKTIAPDLLPNDKMHSIISCTGNKTCKLGITNSRGLAYRIQYKFKDECLKVKRALPKINISGCSNSCGSHHSASIGLSGSLKKEGENYIPLYKVMFGGGCSDKTHKLAKEYASLPANSVSCLLVDLAKLKVESGLFDFNRFLEEKVDGIKTLLDKYTEFRPIEESSFHFTEPGSTELFDPKKKS